MAASNVHAAVQVNIAYEVRRLTNYRVYTELSILIDGAEYKPDVSVYPYEQLNRKHDIVKMEKLPVGAMEIVSPTQFPQQIVSKIETYLNAGIQSCWLVLPYPASVTVYTGNTEKMFTEGNVCDSVLGIEIPIENIWV